MIGSNQTMGAYQRGLSAGGKLKLEKVAHCTVCSECHPARALFFNVLVVVERLIYSNDPCAYSFEYILQLYKAWKDLGSPPGVRPIELDVTSEASIAKTKQIIEKEYDGVLDVQFNFTYGHGVSRQQKEAMEVFTQK